MASTSAGARPPDPPYWILAKDGIRLLINNQSDAAVELFRSHSENIQMAAGYSFAIFMDALMSFEDDKVQAALVVLRDTEKRCAAEIGWLKSVKAKVFGGKDENLAETLENQIILADTQVCMAILIFLQQDFSSYLKGGWVLRKAWKVYQHAYVQILGLYKQVFGDLHLPAPTDLEWADDGESSAPSEMTSSASCEWLLPAEASSAQLPGAPTPSSSHPKNGYMLSSLRSKLSQSRSAYALHRRPSPPGPADMRRSGSVQSSLAAGALGGSRSALSLLSSQLGHLTSSLGLLAADRNAGRRVEPRTVARLMGAVCFGYGTLQLGISLLPPSLLKVSSYLGFEGNRAAGISNLMYARKGSDMRAPLAILALLWYHTIVRPFYALDGCNVQAGVDAANTLLNEADAEFGQSALFLFFKGRVHRLNSNIPAAIENFRASIDNSTQREIILLSLYEIGWCYLMQLDYAQADRTFRQLKSGSRWSRSYYSYLLILCTGALGQPVDLGLVTKLTQAYAHLSHRGTQLEIFLQRRFKVLPTTRQQLDRRSPLFWSILVYELLYLWNAMPNCSPGHLNQIITDCEAQEEEPMPGLAKLIQGECYSIKKLQASAVDSLRVCLSRRGDSSSRDDLHVSAFAEYTLGDLLLKSPQTFEEGRALLQHASHYKDYDFDSKLQARIELALKQLQ